MLRGPRAEPSPAPRSALPDRMRAVRGLAIFCCGRGWRLVPRLTLVAKSTHPSAVTPSPSSSTAACSAVTALPPMEPEPAYT
jgi:hypothetical protein